MLALAPALRISQWEIIISNFQYQDLRKKEKENRKLQQELKSEKDKFDQMVSKYVKEVQDLHASIYEESQWKNKLQMELDTKVGHF